MATSFKKFRQVFMAKNRMKPLVCSLLVKSQFLIHTAGALSAAPKLFFSLYWPVNSEKKYEKAGIKIEKVVTDDGVVHVKKKVYQPRISLIGTDNNLQVITLEEADKIAKRRNLKLIKILEKDSKTDRATYKLVNVGNEASSAHNKGDKLMTISSKISYHDLQSKINHILKWLKKENTVRVTISGESGVSEKIFNEISDKIKNDGRIPQKVFKGGEIRFQIILPKKIKTPKTEDSSTSSDGLP